MSLASIFKIQLCKVKLFINTNSSLQPFLGKHLLKLESIRNNPREIFKTDRNRYINRT